MAHPGVAAEMPQQYLGFLGLTDPLPAMITNHRFDVLSWNHVDAGIVR